MQTINHPPSREYPRNNLVDIFSIVFGIGSWIGVNSVFVQLPILVESAPEKWSLSSYLVLFVQLGNVGPLLYTILHRVSASRSTNDSAAVYTVLAIGTTASILVAYLSEKTVFVNKEEYSLPLFILVFFMALTGCTSSVLFIPYMGRFKEPYLITYFMGEGLSGLLPSILALAQGIGSNDQCLSTNSTGPGIKYEQHSPRFGSKVFFVLIFVLMLGSCLAFILLDKLKISKQQYAAVKCVEDNHEMSTTKRPRVLFRVAKEKYTLMFLMGVVCLFGNGVLPSLQPYSCLPYGSVVYHWTASFSCIANTIACFLAMFLPHSSFKSVLALFACSTILASYILVTVVLSPTPPLIDSPAGPAIVVICWTFLMGIVTYIKLSITTIMRNYGQKSLVWIGATSQVGSAAGSLCIFIVINFFKLLKTYEHC